MPTNSPVERLPELTRQAIEWLVLLRSGEISDSETHDFAEWLSQDVEHAQAFARAENLLEEAASAALRPRVVEDGIFPSLATGSTQWDETAQEKLTAKRRSPVNRIPLWLAVPMALAAAWLFAVNLIQPAQSYWLKDLFSDFHTGTGEIQEIQLADGSQAVLDSNTALSVDMNGGHRHITLAHGRAQFTVAKDTSRPFEVVAGEITSRALGTVFEVDHPEPGNTAVTVLEHAVAVKNANQADTIQQPSTEVQAGQRIRYENGQLSAEAEPVNLAQAGAWQQRKLFLNDRPLAELVAELNRNRTGRIFISDPALKQMKITGAFSLAQPDATLAKVVSVLALQETRIGPLWTLLHR